jgi:putative DNA primase/helicase
MSSKEGKPKGIELTERAPELLAADPELRKALATASNPEARGAARMAALVELIKAGVLPEPPIVPEKVHEPIAQGSPLASIRHVAAAAPRLRSRLILESMDDCEEEEFKWLWPCRIAMGTVNMIMGKMGDGKSTFTSWLAAQVSAGLPWPDVPDDNEPGTVLILQAEESRGKSIKPRINAFGYGHGKIYTIKGVDRGDGRESWFSLALDSEALSDACERIGDVRLVIVDPLDSYVRGFSGYNAPEVRECLQPMFSLAEAHDLAVLLVAHPNKDGEKDILDRVSGSGAFMQMVRMAWYLSEDPNDRSRRLLSLMKANPDGATRTALAWHYDRHKRVITWLSDPVKLSGRQVDHLLQKQDREAKLKSRPGPEPALTEKAQEFLLNLLKAGPTLQSAAQDQALNQGIKGSTFRDALKRLVRIDGRVLHGRHDGDDRWWLSLGVVPSEDPPGDHPEGEQTPDEAPPEAPV